MDQIVKGSRRVLLGVAFVSVMAGTGGFMGAVAGVIVVLMSHVVLGVKGGMIEVLPAAMLFGALLTASIGIFLMARQPVRAALKPRLVSVPQPKSEPIASEQVA